jgi:O-methyltransferase
MDNLQKYRLRRSLKQVFSKFFFALYRLQASHRVDTSRHAVFISECTYAPWMNDSKFEALYARIKDNTMVDKNKVYLIYSYIDQLCKLGVRGGALEVGVWRGGVGAFIALAFKQFSGAEVDVFLADTYEGMPKTKDEDNFYRGGELSDTSITLVEKLMRSNQLTKVQLLKGYFPDDTASRIEAARLAFVHIDVDIFESASKTFDWAWSRLSDYGMVVFDDYGYSSTEGVTNYIDEKIKAKPDAFFMFNMGGQAVVIKMPRTAS